MISNRYVTPSLALIALIFVSPLAKAFEYKLESSLPRTERMAVQDLLDQAKNILPAKVQRSLKTVSVRVEHIKVQDTELSGLALRFSNRIVISKKLLPEIVAGPERSQKIDQRHGSMYKDALATVVHETIHLYDRLNLHSPEEQAWIRKCNPIITSDKREKAIKSRLPEMCRYYTNIHTTFSGNPYFLSVAGFTQDSFNGYTKRSPDPYELKNARETFAVNTEFFLMDPEYKCRRPTFYRLLAGHFEHTPFADVKCQGNLNFVLPKSFSGETQFLGVDPARVYQVHYLLAEKGEAMMSGWGHAMIRLVICKENRPVGPDCLLDIDQHLVLSYRAFVDSLSINSMDGLTGQYPSRLFILPMHQILDEYNKIELRGLRSLPLKLTRREVVDFVTRAVESHWSYDGKYYFISNNCATETLNLLKSSFFTHKFLQIQTKTPIDLYDSLVRQGVGDTSVFKDQKEAVAKGYYFASYEQRYKITFEILKKATRFEAETFKSYLALSALERAQVIAKIPHNKNNIAGLAAALLLENAAALQQRSHVMLGIQNIVVQMIAEAEKSQTPPHAEQSIVDIAKNFLALSESFSQPSDFLSQQPGYGLALNEEKSSAAAAVREKGAKALEMEKANEKLIEDLISAKDKLESEQIKANLIALTTAITEIKK